MIFIIKEANVIGSVDVDCLDVVFGWRTALNFFIFNQWWADSTALSSHPGSWSSSHQPLWVAPLLVPWMTHILNLLFLGVCPNEGSSRRMAHCAIVMATEWMGRMHVINSPGWQLSLPLGQDTAHLWEGGIQLSSSHVQWEPTCVVS